MGKRLLLRTDGGPDMGIGHFMRCFALAEAWSDLGGSARFAMNLKTEFILQKAASEGFDVSEVSPEIGSGDDAEATARLVEEMHADWIVLDGYRFDEEYQSAMNDLGCRVLLIDDYAHSTRQRADIILNQNAGARAAIYRPHDPDTHLLIGPQYALLRREFRQSPKKEEFPETAGVVLVTLGGGQQLKTTRKILTALSSPDLKGLRTVVAAGSDAGYRDELTRQIGPGLETVRISDPDESMTELMTQADLAISAGGTTTWDLAGMGVPFIGLAVAENQMPGLSGAADAGVAVNLGWHELVSVETLIGAVRLLRDDQDLRKRMSRNGPRLVPGTGAVEVSKLMMSLV